MVSIIYLTLSYARDRIKSEQLHYRLGILLGNLILAGGIIGLLLWNSNIYTFSLLIMTGVMLSVEAICLEVKCFKLETLAALEYWSVASFVLVYCATALIPQLIY